MFNGSNEKWSFSASGWLTSQAGNGNATTLNYNSNGTLASITDSQGRVTTFGYDSTGRLEKIVDPTALEAAHYYYDTGGRLKTAVDREGQPASFGYDTANNLTSITDGEELITILCYDSADRVTQVSILGNDAAAATNLAYGNVQTGRPRPPTRSATPNPRPGPPHGDVTTVTTYSYDPLNNSSAPSCRPGRNTTSAAPAHLRQGPAGQRAHPSIRRGRQRHQDPLDGLQRRPPGQHLQPAQGHPGTARTATTTSPTTDTTMDLAVRESFRSWRRSTGSPPSTSAHGSASW